MPEAAVYGTEIVVLDLLGNDIYRLDLAPIKGDTYTNVYYHRSKIIESFLLNENRSVAVLNRYNPQIILMLIQALNLSQNKNQSLANTNIHA